jgi:hypothetical protein
MSCDVRKWVSGRRYSLNEALSGRLVAKTIGDGTVTHKTQRSRQWMTQSTKYEREHKEQDQVLKKQEIGVLKLKHHSHHQMERWRRSRAGRWLKGTRLDCRCVYGTRYRICLHTSRDSEVTPPCSIQPLPFGDVLVVSMKD